MFYITGMVVENARTVAYSLYDVDSKKSIIVSSKSVKRMLKDEEEIVGFALYTDYRGKKYVRKNKRYMWRNLPEINGKGIPEKEEDKDILILIGSNGFKEVKQFVLVNSVGEMVICNMKELQERIKSNKIVGAVVNSLDRILFGNELELDDKWIEEAGFERDCNDMWKKKEA